VSERFYCPDPPRAGRYWLSADESRHLARVCRLGIGDRVELFDGRGFTTMAEIVASSGDRTELVAAGDPIPERGPSCSLVLATAIPKGDRFDWLVEKATELGVARLIPIVAERSVVVPRGSKLDRLRRTIVEACKQSRRSRLMELEEPMEWPEVVGRVSGEARFLAEPHGLPVPRWPTVHRDSVAVLAVGPEGGFTGAEMGRAIETGWIPIRLSYNVLRVETAGLAGCASLLARVAETEE
jgi:16S rRNA (uracil1498-N3)-methyltransferase